MQSKVIPLSPRNEAILAKGQAVILAILQRNVCCTLCLRVKEPHTLPIYKLNVLMTLLFYTLHFPEDVNIYICEDVYKVLSHISYFFSSRLQVRAGNTFRDKELRNDRKSNEVIATELVRELGCHCSVPCHFAMQAPMDTVTKETHVSPDCIFPSGFPL